MNEWMPNAPDLCETPVGSVTVADVWQISEEACDKQMSELEPR